MSAALYDAAVEALLTGGLDWERAQIKLMLATSDYEPSQTGHVFRTDVVEVDPSGTYERGGALLTGRSVSREGLLGSTRLLATGTVAWSGFTGRFRYAIVYQATGVRSEDQLVTCCDLGEQDVTNASITLEFDPDLGVTEFLVERASG